MANNRINRNSVPEGFTIPLVVVDALPVIFFTLSLIIVGKLFDSLLFVSGALLVLVAGVAKVIWKLIVVLKKKNVWILFSQMRFLMPIGFILMIVSVFLKRNTIDLNVIFVALTSFPSALFFAFGACGIGMMILFAIKLDSLDVKTNWIEQLTNGVAQIAIFLGLVLLLKR